MTLPASRQALLLLFLLLAQPAAAQTPPVDADEASDATSEPIRIGPVRLTGSAWVDTTLQSGSGSEEVDTFRFRRGRLGASGDLVSWIGWNVSAELTSDSPLRNAFVVIRLADQLNVRAGQFTPPSALERGTSPLVLEVIDRSRVTNELTYRQDMGVSVTNAQPWRGWLSYAVSIINGSGLNRMDENTAKDFVARVELTPPVLRGLTVNVSGGTGEQADGRRTRNGIGIEYDARGFKVMAEGLRQQLEADDDSHGAVVMAAYRLRPRQVTPRFRMLELAARYLVFTHPSAARGDQSSGPDEDGGEGLSGFVPRTTREIQAGLNYYVNSNVRVLSNVIVPTDARPSPDATFVTRLQIVF